MTDQFEIFNPIVSSVAVLVMNVFSFFYLTADVVFHYQTMLHNITVRIGARMRTDQHLNIFSAFPTTAFPIRMLLSGFETSAQFCRAGARASWIFYGNLRGQALKLFSAGRTSETEPFYSSHGVNILSSISFIVKAGF